MLDPTIIAVNSNNIRIIPWDILMEGEKPDLWDKLKIIQGMFKVCRGLQNANASGNYTYSMIITDDFNTTVVTIKMNNIRDVIEKRYNALYYTIKDYLEHIE